MIIREARADSEVNDIPYLWYFATELSRIEGVSAVLSDFKALTEYFQGKYPESKVYIIENISPIGMLVLKKKDKDTLFVMDFYMDKSSTLGKEYVLKVLSFIYSRLACYNMSLLEWNARLSMAKKYQKWGAETLPEKRVMQRIDIETLGNSLSKRLKSSKFRTEEMENE